MTGPLARAIAGPVHAGEPGSWSADAVVERYLPGSVIEAAATTQPPPGPCMKWLVDGWTCEARVLADGQRQIFSFAVPGDVVELPRSPRSRTVVALTLVDCIDAADVLARAADPDGVLEAMTHSVGLARARRYEHLARLGRRSALVRLSSLLVELHDRLAEVGLVRSEAFALPLRHEELADALGLSPVHVTRCLKALRQRGLLTMKFRRVSGFDRAGLERLCD